MLAYPFNPLSYFSGDLFLIVASPDYVIHNAISHAFISLWLQTKIHSLLVLYKGNDLHIPMVF
jgi:hypothetical protein